MTEHAVVIAGGGPTGLMLAGELALAGIDVVIVERRTNQDVDGSRAGGLHSRTIEVLDQRGIAERFLSAGQVMQVQGFAGIPLDISDFPTRHNYGLALWQSHFEPILAGWVGELGVPILRGCEVVGFAQDDTGVDVELSDDASLRAEYLVGCDGGRSVVRKAAGIDFVGLDPSTSWMIAEVEMDEEPEFGFRRDSVGTARHRSAAGRRADPGRAHRTRGRAHRRPHHGRPPRGTRRRVRDGLRAAQRHLDLPVHRHDAAGGRPTASGRVLLAGDAAHVHPPQGGQGLNTGVQDAVNLGWKLAQVVDGTSPESLLDTYHAERHPVGARVLRNTMAQVALEQPRRPSPGAARHHDRAAEHGRAAPAHRRDALRSRHPLRPRRGTPAARAAHARPRPAHRRRSDARVHPAARRPAGAPRPRCTRRLRHRAVGGSSPVGRRRRTTACGSSRSSARSLRPRPC